MEMEMEMEKYINAFSINNFNRAIIYHPTKL
jgi:hypothetical protein